ncbi:hypothetical protein OG618_03240 [Kitasatospora sp. NBC_01246]|uniref:hypothetical protein n=1 Tax=Kitasatospora sp. NBC_01246 TaxID=2903570 RepID=UPI002E351D1D|nr:hypothetical protein [Kitasatospora sp. NBC_01246]
MSDPRTAPKVPDLPPAEGTEAPDIPAAGGEEGRTPAGGPTADRNGSAAETTRAENEDEPPD